MMPESNERPASREANMGTRSILIATVAVVSSCAVAAHAALNLNSSRSNIYRLDPHNPNAAAECTKANGKISKDDEGQKICTLPEKPAAPAPNAPKN
jgi:hypothetical protein